MEGRELDPYEQQLLAVFESCDRNHVGSLDSHGLEQLCEKLQLEEQGMELIQCLLGGLGSDKRVTFPEFKDGLLALLGDEQGDIHSKQREDRGSPEREVSPKFVFGKKKYGRRSRPESREQDVDADNNESLEDSDLEIFVEVGDKEDEITMRSVPEETSGEDIKEKKKIVINSTHSPDFKKESLLFRRRSSAEELQDNLNSQVWQNSPEVGGMYNDEGNLPSLGQVGDNEEECLRAAWDRLGVGKDGFLDRGELALVCECIGMEKVAEEVVQQLFEKLDVDRDGRISFEEFLLLFRSGGSWVPSNAGDEVVQEKREAGVITTFPQASKKTNELQTLVPSSDQTPQFLSLNPNSAGFVSAELIVEMWEAAGIRRPLQLLQDLGFSAQRINMAELAVVLEEELNTLNEENRNEVPSETATLLNNPRETLLQAMLALYQAEVRCLKMSLEHMSAERDKLRADIMDANQRASLLAQEIDDHHARLEKSSQLQVRLLEQRHSEQLRELTEQLTADREQLAVQNMALEKQLLSLQEEESRLRTQVATLQSENELLEKENHNIMEQLAKAEEAKKELQKEIESLAGLQQRLNELEGSRDQEQVLPLIEKLNELQAENTGLRDRNDELTMEVEALTAKLAAIRTKRVPVLHPGHDAMDSESASEEVGSSSAIKRRNEFPPILPPEDSSEEESPRLGKMRRCCENNIGDIQDTSLEGLQIHSLGHGESGVEADLALDDSEGAITDSSFVGEEKLKGEHCSHWLDQESHLVSSCRGETDELAMLRSRVAKLEQELKQQTDKLLVYENARSQMKENVCQYCASRDESDAVVPTKQVKGQLKQVFQVIRKQVMQELLEDSARQSSLKEQWSKDNQRNEEIATSGKSIGSLKVTNYPFTDSVEFAIPMPSNGMVFCPSGNTKKRINLQEDCRDLGSQLDLIKVEILNILSEKKACSKENCALKQHISELKNKLDNQCLLSDTDNKCVPTQEAISVSQNCKEDKSEVVVNVNIEHGSENTNASYVTKASGDVGSMEDIPENNEKPEAISSGTNECANKTAEDNVASRVEDLHRKLKEQELKHQKEVSDLQERCTELESSLELLRQEYEKCEDYWATKLEEERHLFDQEQKMSDEKFSELMSKIKEYEELFGAQDNRSDDSDRLSTIEERASLEKQFTDLEEEFEEFRLKMEQEQNERDEEIMRLREQLRALEQQQKHSESKLNVAVQVTDLENGSWESDRTFVVELEGARKAITNEIAATKAMNNSPSVMMNGYKRSSVDRKILASSRSSTPASSQSTDTDSTELRTELCRLRNLKDRLNDECHSLKEQKEQLIQEVLNMQTGKAYSSNGIGKPFSLPPHANRSASQACRIDLNVLQALNARLKQQEQECRHLQLTLKQQQQQNDSITKRANQKHEEELTDLKLQLQKTEEQLQHQTTTCKEQMERLARTDILVKELYVENAYLMATVQNLEQRCQVLAQMTSDSSSV